MELRGWNLIDAERAVLWREYEFTRGAYATTLVFRGVDGLVVVSPGRGLEPADYAALAPFGEVRALVANNPYHHLGQRPWREHFPRAESYATPQALATLRAKAADIPFRSLDELALPPWAHLDALPGFKHGDVLVRVGTARGSLWYTSDLLTNIHRTPGPPMSWVFNWTGSAPGFRLFKLAVWGFVKDRRAVRARMTELLAEDPPAVIVPGHGPLFSCEDLPAAVRAQLTKL